LVTSDLIAANEIPGRRIHQLIGVKVGGGRPHGWDGPLPGRTAA